MEIKYICEEWRDKYNFPQDFTSVSDDMITIDSKLKKIEKCCVEAGLGSIGYIDKTGLIDEWYDILDRLVTAIDGVDTYIHDHIEAPFQEKMGGIYDQMMSMSLENYTTENTLHLADHPGMARITTLQEKESITLKDLLGMTNTVNTKADAKSLDSLTGIYQQQYESYKGNNKDVSFDDFMIMTCGFHDDRMTSDDMHLLLDMAGMIPILGEPIDIINGIIYFCEGDKLNGSLSMGSAIPIAGNALTATKMGKKVVALAGAAVVVKKGSRIAEGAAILLKQRKEVSLGLDEALEVVEGATSTVKKLTSADVITAIEKNGMTVEEFSKLLDPNITLTPEELKLVDKVRADIGLPQAGTVMNKTIPQSDIYNYLYNENYTGIRGFVSVDEHSSALKTLDEVFEGNCLDYDNTKFKAVNGVDGVSQSVGGADTVYGKITYVLEDADTVKVPTDFPIADNAPYTGRGFTGSKDIVMPELVQENRKFVTGDILSIYDSNTGNVVSQFVYDKKLGEWILNE